MITENIVENIENFFNNNKSYVTRVKFLKDNYPEIFNKVNSGKIIENLYKLLYDVVTTPVCMTCGKIVKFDTFQNGYKDFCSHKCALSNERTLLKRKKTNLKKYGVEHSLSNKQVRKKRKDTMISKYGFEYPLQNDNLKEKVNLKNKKRSQEDWTNIHEKRKSSFLKKYGVENLWDNPSFVEKINKTNLEKYGVKWVQQNSDILNRRQVSQKKNFLEVLENRFENIAPAFDYEDYTGINLYQGGSIYMWKCELCQYVFERKVTYEENIQCPQCFPSVNVFSSKGEKEIASFLEFLCVNFEIHNRTIASPYEIDFLLLDHNIAIEYCGLYWHSDKKVDKIYHSRKCKLCAEKGIKLITIFEDEWLFKKDVCKSRISFALHRQKPLCGARQTKISEISVKQYKDFINKFHIQGYSPAKIKIGAYFNNELVAVMSFGKLRKALGSNSIEEGVFEMIRFSCKANIPGMASKMYSFFIKQYNPIKVISYCDLRWGSGDIYKMLGFTLERETLPNYWYTRDGLSRYHRYQFRKQVLIKQGFDKNLTEREIMDQLGYYRIYDCGNYKFIWKK